MSKVMKTNSLVQETLHAQTLSIVNYLTICLFKDKLVKVITISDPTEKFTHRIYNLLAVVHIYTGYEIKIRVQLVIFKSLVSIRILF